MRAHVRGPGHCRGLCRSALAALLFQQLKLDRGRMVRAELFPHAIAEAALVAQVAVRCRDVAGVNCLVQIFAVNLLVGEDFVDLGPRRIDGVKAATLVGRDPSRWRGLR